ncbi:hypothetical protein HO173_001338 [Letharia columbiana]|uniref:Uncharacterized protein n=1 Tax=Letharia columbiana TaxID=112416 RepID=A0A8H6L9N9_9LECA|nr:uncharacterized protein HO173_001338 [Letharia columbiana]KAF6240666.1 hypothetical protein HO173_001338 [Letharia columbiana]
MRTTAATYIQNYYTYQRTKTPRDREYNLLQPISNPPTSTPKYVPPHRRSPTYRGEPYLTYDDLHRRYSPPNSPSLHMPRVQRSLSAEDLYQRYHRTPTGISAPPPSPFHTNQEETQGQNSPGISAPPPSPPPPTPRDFEALRAYRHRLISPQPVRQPLSPRLPDPPVFTGTNSISFDDWKMRIQDKLTHNSDYFLTNTFKITYVIARLKGKAS